MEVGPVLKVSLMANISPVPWLPLCARYEQQPSIRNYLTRTIFFATFFLSVDSDSHPGAAMRAQP